MTISLDLLTDQTFDLYEDEHADRLDEIAHIWRSLERIRGAEAHPRDRLRLATWLDITHGATLPPDISVELDELMRDLTVEMLWRDDERIESIMDRTLDCRAELIGVDLGG